MEPTGEPDSASTFVAADSPKFLIFPYLKRPQRRNRTWIGIRKWPHSVPTLSLQTLQPTSLLSLLKSFAIHLDYRQWPHLPAAPIIYLLQKRQTLSHKNQKKKNTLWTQMPHILPFTVKMFEIEFCICKSEVSQPHCFLLDRLSCLAWICILEHDWLLYFMM